MQCYVCKKEFNEAKDFVEEIELLEALDYFINIEGICPECIYKLRDKLFAVVDEFLQEK